MKFLDAVAKADELSKDKVGKSIFCVITEKDYKVVENKYINTPKVGYYTEPLPEGYSFYGNIKNINPIDLINSEFIVALYFMDTSNFNRITYKKWEEPEPIWFSGQLGNNLMFPTTGKKRWAINISIKDN